MTHASSRCPAAHVIVRFADRDAKTGQPKFARTGCPDDARAHNEGVKNS